MSQSFFIELTFGRPVALDVLFSCLAGAGWSPVAEGGINYMVSDHEWRYEDRKDFDSVRKHMEQSLERDEVVGISLWAQEGNGINVLIFQGREKVDFLLDLNTRFLKESPCDVDMGWYLQRIVPPLEALGLTGVTTQPPLRSQAPGAGPVRGAGQRSGG